MFVTTCYTCDFQNHWLWSLPFPRLLDSVKGNNTTIRLCPSLPMPASVLTVSFASNRILVLVEQLCSVCTAPPPLLRLFLATLCRVICDHKGCRTFERNDNGSHALSASSMWCLCWGSSTVLITKFDDERFWVSVDWITAQQSCFGLAASAVCFPRGGVTGPKAAKNCLKSYWLLSYTMK